MPEIEVCVVSDIHGYIPSNVPDCDLFIVAGDLTHEGRNGVKGASWINKKFVPFAEDLKRRGIQVLVIAGNHDYCFQTHWHLLQPNVPWKYLENTAFHFKGLKIWGSPWTPFFFNWAFNTTESDLKRMYSAIPKDTDILITHGPPKGILDLSPYGMVNAGSTSLKDIIPTLTNLKLHIFGHIHHSRGELRTDSGLIHVNASYVKEDYKPHGSPLQIFKLSV